MSGRASQPTYGVVTPVRDEGDRLRQLHAALAAQTVSPKLWVIVDTGSTDNTRALAAELTLPKTRIHCRQLDLGLARPVRGGPVVRAFQHGFDLLGDAVELVVKVDADVSFGSSHFERLLQTFAVDDRLGIVSGTRCEFVRGQWRRTSTPTLEAQCRAYRSRCLKEIVPLEERLGWDTIDEISARARGWKTLVIGDLTFRHHRPLGRRDGRRLRAWFAQGQASHYLHYRPTYALLRSLYRARSEPAALGLVVGYLAAAAARRPRQPSTQVRRYMRERQRLSALARIRERHT